MLSIRLISPFLGDLSVHRNLLDCRLNLSYALLETFKYCSGFEELSSNVYFSNMFPLTALKLATAHQLLILKG
jgi:hypothetical protein